jgi:hypothetical protein
MSDNVKPVSFKKDEQYLIDFVKGKYFSAYVKELIKKDMQGYKPIEKIEETHKTRRNANFEM